jgi:hypothetical protein
MITERHHFRGLPLRATGNIAVASVSGWVLWHLRDNGGSLQLAHITEMWLMDKDGGEVALLADQPLYQAVQEELERTARSLSNRSRSEEAPVPIAEAPFDPNDLGDLDSTQCEGAQQPSTAT